MAEPDAAPFSTAPAFEATLDEAHLVALARQLAPALEAPMNCYFQGELGAGKTTFIRALVQALGHDGPVKSPSYGLMEVYTLQQLTLVHLDLYRISDPEELEFLGLADWLGPQTLLFVEWPQQGAGALPAADLVFELSADSVRGMDLRRLRLLPQSDSGIKLCRFINNAL